MTASISTGTPDETSTLAQVLCAFAYANDLAFGLQLEDTLRSCYLASRIATQLGLSEEIRSDAYVAALLKDAGCTSWTSELASVWRTDEIAARREMFIFSNAEDPRAFIAWMRRHVARDEPALRKLQGYFQVLTGSRALFQEAFATTAAVACRIAGRLGATASVQAALLDLFEQWDGTGHPQGLAGADIPIVSRIVFPTFFLVPVHRVSGRQATIDLASALRGEAFDPVVMDAFLQLAADETFWAELEAPDIQQRVLALEPDFQLVTDDEAAMEAAALAFADFIDLKSRYTAAHSRRVAAVAELLARIMQCAEPAVAQIRRAALVHDLGMVAIPSHSLERPWPALSEAERDQYRLHAYHGERILRRVPAFAPLAEMVGTHHERADGSGYYRGLTGPHISLGARIIAVADRLDGLTHDGPGTVALPLPAALDVLRGEPFDTEVVTALRRAVGITGSEAPATSAWPAGLTDREVQVLKLAARGLPRREVARRLGITENTARHHLEHIYNKTGAPNRVSATLFAMEHGLLND